MKKFKTWFFEISETANKRGTRFRNGDRPDQSAFQNLLDSVVLRSEPKQKAKEDDNTTDVTDLVGHVVAATDAQAKSYQDKKNDRTLVTQPNQLPEVKEGDNITLNFNSPNYISNLSNAKTIEVENSNIDPNSGKRNVFRLTAAYDFLIWIYLNFQALDNVLKSVFNTVTSHTSQINSNTSAISSLLGGGSVDPNDVAPIGSLVTYVGTTDVNSRWFLCDGRSLLRADYPGLFNVIGTSFGEGNNPGVTFALPNTSDKFLKGKNSEIIGTTGGSNSILLTQNQIPQHSHNVSLGGGAHGHTWALGQPASYKEGSDVALKVNTVPATTNSFVKNGGATDITSSSGSHNHSGTTNTQHSNTQEAVNTMPFYLSINYLIKVI